MRSLMELDAQTLVGERDGCVDGGVGAYENALVDHCRAAGDDRPGGIVIRAAYLAPFAGAVNIRLTGLERLLVIRRAHEVVIAATRVGPVELGLDPGGDDLEFEAL